LGLIIVLFPILSALITATFLIYLIAIQAIVVGTMEIAVAIRARALLSQIWPVLLSGILYVLFGIALAVAPLMGAQFFIVFAGVMMILFAAGLFVLAFRLYRGAAATSA
ncbi:MAG: DUF308 domain-containing protein, partial [Devosia sp.]